MERFLKKIINNGDESGNEKVVKFKLPSGLEIFSLPKKIFTAGTGIWGPPGIMR